MYTHIYIYGNICSILYLMTIYEVQYMFHIFKYSIYFLCSPSISKITSLLGCVVGMLRQQLLSTVPLKVALKPNPRAKHVNAESGDGCGCGFACWCLRWWCTVLCWARCNSICWTLRSQCRTPCLENHHEFTNVLLYTEREDATITPCPWSSCTFPTWQWS